MNATSTHIETITPDAARQRMTSGAGALLVCAYDSDQKFQEHRLAGAIPFSQFQSRVATLPKDKEIIFYCACPHDESSLAKAEEYRARGFTNVKALEGGENAWKGAGDEEHAAAAATGHRM